jgi:methylmalonyl-CoA mutase
MSDFLFDEFNPVTAQEWKQKIQMDLKGADYNETLIWKSLEGIDVKPFYHSEEHTSSPLMVPGIPKSWKIANEVFIDNESIANKLALNALERGADAIVFIAEKEFDIKSVFQNFPFSRVSLYLNLNFLSIEFLLELDRFLSDNKATVFYGVDILGNLIQTGNWYHDLNQDHATLDQFSKTTKNNTFSSVDLSIYQNAGANMIQQLAYGMAHVNEYLNFLNPSDQLKKFFPTFSVSLGSNYFFEIAKIRALRLLYGTLAKEYNCSEECHIIARPSKRNKTLYDYNVNMLRTTTEYMSAILGGADSVCSAPYDSLYHKSNEFGERISRNQLLILRSESYVKFENDPIQGTYYIEHITKMLAEKALNLFKSIETQGGLLKQIKAGVIQRKVKESADKEQSLFDKGVIKLLGTNIHINPDDSMKDDLELYPFTKKRNEKTLIEPILPKRLSENIEQERLKTE